MYNIKEKEQELFTRWAASLHLSEEEFCPNESLGVWHIKRRKQHRPLGILFP